MNKQKNQTTRINGWLSYIDSVLIIYWEIMPYLQYSGK